MHKKKNSHTTTVLDELKTKKDVDWHSVPIKLCDNKNILIWHSICSIHSELDVNCSMCVVGQWVEFKQIG